ncbi:MAG: hypothetical protein HQL63_10180 [Magnetococcales bacterium]|nr:hypothetical protein [Magnetococcales bacterium]MBF0322057.1 hypothetical protein [Magnetococcales bacterium]
MRVSNRYFIFLVSFIISGIQNFDKLGLDPFMGIRTHDTFDSEFPRLYNLGHQLFHGGLQLWYPQSAGGMSAMAYHFSPLHPVAILSNLLPPWLYYGISATFFSVLGCFGMIVLLNEFFSVPLKNSIFVATLFISSVSLNGKYTIFDFFIIMFPFIFIILHNNNAIIQDKNKLLFLFESIILVFISLFAYPALILQTFPLLHFAVLAIFFVEIKKIEKPAVASALLFWVGFLLVSLPVLISLLEYVPLAARKYSLIPWQKTGSELWFLLTNNPLFFLAVGSLATMRSSGAPAMASLTVLLLFSAIFLSYSPLSVGTFLEKIDLHQIVGTIPTVMALHVALSLRNLDSAKGGDSHPFRFFLTALTAWLFVAIFSLASPRLLIVHLLVIIMAWVLVWGEGLKYLALSSHRIRTLKSPVHFFVFLLIFLSLVRPFRSNLEKYPYYETFGHTKILAELAKGDPLQPIRVGTVGVIPSVAQMAILETVGGRSIFFNKYYKEFFGEIIRPQFLSNKDKDAFESYFYDLKLYDNNEQENFPSIKDFNLELLRLAGVQHIISDREIEGFGHYKEKFIRQRPGYFKDGVPPPLFIYKLDRAFQRIRMVENAVILDSDASVLEKLRHADHAYLESNVLISQESIKETGEMEKKVAMAPGKKCGEVKVDSYTPDAIKVTAWTQESCWLVIANNFEPQWKSLVDGRPAKLYRANHTFQAIPVFGAGHHEVDIRYQASYRLWYFLAVPFGIVAIVAARRVARRFFRGMEP